MSVRTQPLTTYGVMASFRIAAFGSGIAQANRPVTRSATLSALNAGAYWSEAVTRKSRATTRKQRLASSTSASVAHVGYLRHLHPEEVGQPLRIQRMSVVRRASRLGEHSTGREDEMSRLSSGLADVGDRVGGGLLRIYTHLMPETEDRARVAVDDSWGSRGVGVGSDPSETAFPQVSAGVDE